VNLLTGIFELVFWLSSLLVVYTFVGYGILISVLALFFRRPVRIAQWAPTVSLIVSAYNEENVIAEKIENCFAVDYPRELLEFIIVADGSNDCTTEIVQTFAARGIKLLHQPTRRGKIAAMNRAVPFAGGQILVFSDADAMLEPQAIRMLVANLADPKVACVGGEKRIRQGASVQAKGEGAYWRYEAYLKRLDSNLNTAIGAIGELFAIRRELYRAMDEDLLIEDFVVTMHLVAAGWRVVYEPRAITWENASPSLAGEWRRRVRVAAGGFQAIGRLKGMLNPMRGFAAFQYISHKVLRWLSPFFMIVAFGANLGLLDQPFYQWTMLAQVVFYSLAALGFVLARLNLRFWPVQIPFYFCFANATSLAGFWRWVTKSQPVTWVKAR
jgi:cellulose synthase/poly-beta-1,6-N-acetylglucosamine synthase-like glycosyltransferase